MPKISKTQAERLTNLGQTADHLTHFVNKWLPKRNRPDHITDMLIRFSAMPKEEQREYRVIDDELYHIQYDPELFRKTQNGEWISNKKPEKYK